MDEIHLEAARSKLKELPMFEELWKNDQAIDLFAKKLVIETRKKGDNIITEGDPGENLFILHKGSVVIKKFTFENDLYTVVSLDSSSQVVFGEQGMLDKSPRSATVFALTDCELFSLSREDFMYLAKNHPEYAVPLLLFMSRELSRRLRKSNQDIITLFDALVREIREKH